MSFSALHSGAITVAHLVNPYLLLTQGWLHNEIVFNTQCRGVVLCQYRIHADLFPLEDVYPVFPCYGARAALSMLVARARARYSVAPYLRIVNRETAHVLHGHFSHESWRNIGLVRSTGLPLVTTFYGVDVGKLPRRAVWKRRYPVLFDEGKAFVVEGPHMADCLETLGCPRDKIRVVYQGADVERIRRHCVEKDPGKVRVLFVGLARFKKGSEHAVRAFIEVARSDPRIELHLVGDGAYRKLTARLLSRAGLLHRAVYHGYVDVDTYLSLLGSADLLLAPSLAAPNGDSEGGAPVCVVEALVAGVPVVGTNHCDVPNIVSHGETGLLCGEGDVGGLAANLARLATDRKQRLDMGQRARELSPARHDIRVRVKGITEVYRSVLS